MLKSKIFHCIVDDTALITNITEIEGWVLRRAIALIVPLHTLGRLHILKKDASQIGQNARKAVKFLDEATSNLDVKIFIQEPDDQYPTWAQVEAHYNEVNVTGFEQKENIATVEIAPEDEAVRKMQDRVEAKNSINKSDTNDQVSKIALDNLTLSKGENTSPVSTPPLSPASSGPQSSKTSPEVKSATIITHDISTVPPTLKSLINSVVWYTYEKYASVKDVVFLTNSSDTAYLARDFGVVSKTIHQLRVAIGVEEQETKNHDKYQKKHSTPPMAKASLEPKTLFRYEDEETDEEEVVFKPRKQGSGKAPISVRGGNAGSVRSKGHGHSPANSLTEPQLPVQPKPQIPVEEIDPNSFDRGSFARGSTPLVSVGNHSGNVLNNGNTGSTRSPGHRHNHNTGGPSRGGHNRVSGRGVDRGSARGRGRLFVP